MTKTDICNLALGKIGHETISSIDDPNKESARKCKLHYGQALDEALRAHFWTFAMRSLALTRMSDGDTIGQLGAWSSAFPFPAGFRRLKHLENEGGQKLDRFAILNVSDQRCIAINADAVTMYFVTLVEDPDLYTPDFTAALVTLLSSKLARALTGSEQLETTFRQTYLNVDLPAARTADASETDSNENHPLEEILAGSITGRRNGVLEVPIVFTPYTP